ncbi:MAG: hypothetical protein AB1442_18065 [Nitrospirota bacterium]
MKFVIVDYSEIYYGGIAKIERPKKIVGKFVQLRHADTEYLVFSPKEFTRYHADLVEKFCSDRGIDGTYNSRVKRFDIHDPSWTVTGGGKFEADVDGKRLRLYDDSMAYGKFVSKGLKEKILSAKGMSAYKVEIE